MLWSKRDGIYSFLWHLGPFRCITTEIFSKISILSKTGFDEKIPMKTSTAHLVQFFEVFAIFHTWGYTQDVWKIAKKPNHIVKFACGSLRINLYFFRISDFIFQKIAKITTKKIRVTKKLKNYSLVHILWFMFCGDNNFFCFSYFFKMFSEFLQILQK